MDRHEQASESSTQRTTIGRRSGPGLYPKESAKRRASRVRLGYLPGGNLRSRLRRWREFLFEYSTGTDYVSRLRDMLMVIVIAFGLLSTGGVLIWVVPAAVDNTPSADNRFWQVLRQGASRGALATAHATWEDNCQACHISYYPINDQHWAARILRGDDDQLMPSSAQCKMCHRGPAHHPNQHMESELACAGCHQEHRGRDHSLVELQDSKCTQCHAQLNQHMQRDSGKLPGQLRISRFALNQHPEFKDVRAATDPGGLKFNHQVHMTRGMGRSKGAPLFRYGHIRDEPARKRYQGRRHGASDSDYVQLRCQSCHQLDREDLFGDQKLESMSSTNLPARISGAHFLPLVYEHHCQACHPLDIPKRPTEQLVELATSRHEGGRFGQRVGETLPVRHGLDVSVLDQLLTSKFVTVRLQDKGSGWTQELPSPRIPGKSRTVQSMPDAVAVQRDVRLAQQMLFTGLQTCKKCHYYYDAGNGGKRVDNNQRVLELLENKKLKVWPTSVPEIWFEGADFSHAAHRALRCDQCHGPAGSSTSESDLLLPGIETCYRCHGPTAPGGYPRGGAGYRCTDCHRYHQVDRPLLGRGAQSFVSPRRLTSDQFLMGREPSPGKEESQREER